jgi:hypothetical protein
VDQTKRTITQWRSEREGICGRGRHAPRSGAPRPCCRSWWNDRGDVHVARMTPTHARMTPSHARMTPHPRPYDFHPRLYDPQPRPYLLIVTRVSQPTHPIRWNLICGRRVVQLHLRATCMSPLNNCRHVTTPRARYTSPVNPHVATERLPFCNDSKGAYPASRGMTTSP